MLYFFIFYWLFSFFFILGHFIENEDLKKEIGLIILLFFLCGILFPMYIGGFLYIKEKQLPKVKSKREIDLEKEELINKVIEELLKHYRK